MRLLFVLLFASIENVNGNYGGLNKFNKLRRIVDYDRTLLSTQQLADLPKDQWFTQKLDHFNDSITATWKQRFFVNEAYYAHGGPELLNIGGEGTEDPAQIAVDGLPIVEWAKKINARLWSLEHRFYGESQPTVDQSVENLQYLTSQQALADLAAFIDAQNINQSITNPRWVVFGGSYPGALALWFRQKYPKHTVGAVGSSAPIDIQMDFYGYLRVCQDAYRSHSQKCADNIGKAFDHLHGLMGSEKGRNQVEKALNVQPSFKEQNLTFTDFQHFYSNILVLFELAVQNSGVNAGIYKYGFGIPDVCKIMEEPVSSPLTHLVKVYQYLSGGRDIFKDDYQNSVEILKDEEFGEDSSARSWTWQTCNEFGYYQSTAFEKNIFGVGTPADYYYNICSDVYGEKYNVNYIKAAVQRTRDYYGKAEDYNGTHVVIPNGSIDPWHALGTYVNDTEKDQHSYLVEGAAHCADFYKPSKNDVPGLTHIREVIFKKLQDWTMVDRAKSDDTHLTITNKKTKSSNKDKAKKVKKEEMKMVKREPGRVCFGCGGQRESVIRGTFNALNKSDESRGGRHFIKPMLLRQDEDAVFALNQAPNVSKFEQILDHFETDESKIKKFTQYFYLNDEYYEEGGPLFLYIGGESPLGTLYLFNEDIPMVKYAKEVKGAIYGLEHRYYGDSVPVKDFTLKNLVYLTSQQALADLAYFIESVNAEKKYVNPKWITFGGSYSGALSAWFRQKYPEHTVGTIGSSGPLEAKVDYFEYMQVVQESLKPCKDKIKKGIDEIQKLTTTVEGRKIIDDKFGPCDPNKRFDGETVDPFDEMDFYYNLIGRLAGKVQYSAHGPNGTIAEICSTWNDDKYDAIHKFRKTGRPCYSLDINSTIQGFSYTDIKNPYAWKHLWFWQTCNEFGYYQSTDIGYNTFGSGIPVNYYIEWCRRVFDDSFTRDKLEQNIKKTQEYYGGARGFKATKHLHIYGSVDPWHALGFYNKEGEDHGEDVVSVLVEGISHCVDMYPPKEFDPEGLKKARELTLTTIKRWIK